MHIAGKLYRKILGSHEWGNNFEEELSDACLEMMSEIAPREMRRALMTAFGNAKLAKRDKIVPGDLPKDTEKKRGIGFVQ